MESDGSWASVEVSDRGPGIHPLDMSHLFDRSYRADGARSGGSSGLGLAIAQQDAQLLGGELSVTSELGHGAAFRLRLPLAGPDASSN